jgi:hypothetical protein
MFYVIALFFGLLGAKHLDASIVSPLENIDGAIAAIILYVFFLFTDSTHLTDKVGVMDIIGTVAIVVGVVFLGIQEQKLSIQENDLDNNKKERMYAELLQRRKEACAAASEDNLDAVREMEEKLKETKSHK